MSQQSLTFETEVDDRGRIEVSTPLPAHARVTVIVTPRSSEFDGLLKAAESSLGFWDNPLDDEDWNEA